MATTEEAVLDRVRDVLNDLGYKEATALDFKLTPADGIEKAYTATIAGVVPRGGIGLHEEVQAVVTVEVARQIGENYDAARRVCLQRGRALTNAIVRDGCESGEYAVDDAGRTLDVVAPKGASYLTVRVRARVNFEADLSE